MNKIQFKMFNAYFPHKMVQTEHEPLPELISLNQSINRSNQK